MFQPDLPTQEGLNASKGPSKSRSDQDPDSADEEGSEPQVALYLSLLETNGVRDAQIDEHQQAT